MSQRIRRAQERKNANAGSTMATGGYVTRHDRGVDPIVRVPQKATGDVPSEKLSGVAKASPFFKKLAEIAPKTKEEEKKVIANASQPVVKPEDKKEEELEAQ